MNYFRLTDICREICYQLHLSQELYKIIKQQIMQLAYQNEIIKCKMTNMEQM